MSHPVEVVFDVTIDASGTVQVFSYPKDVVANIIVPTRKLKASTLYTDASAALIEFQGRTTGAVEDISGRRFAAFSSTTIDSGFVGNNLTHLLNGPMDCSGAKPFDGYKGTGVSQYYNYGSFGRAMLGAYAHYLFGHVQATAAIDNDTTFVNAMNGEGATDAKIASRLLTALDTMDAAQCTRVAQQVIGQDATRARAVDNDLDTPENWQRLQFVANDIVYMRVRLIAPVVTVNNSRATQLGEPLASAYSPSVADSTYALKITLQ